MILKKNVYCIILELIGKHINEFYLSNLTTANKNNENTRKYNINNVLQILLH